MVPPQRSVNNLSLPTPKTMTELHECNLPEGKEKYIIFKTTAPQQQRHKCMIYHYVVWMAARRLLSEEMGAIKLLSQPGALCKLEKTLLTPRSHCRQFSLK